MTTTSDDALRDQLRRIEARDVTLREENVALQSRLLRHSGSTRSRIGMGLALTIFAGVVAFFVAKASVEKQGMRDAERDNLELYYTYSHEQTKVTECRATTDTLESEIAECESDLQHIKCPLTNPNCSY